jgi:hypothetical protein
LVARLIIGVCGRWRRRETGQLLHNDGENRGDMKLGLNHRTSSEDYGVFAQGEIFAA